VADLRTTITEVLTGLGMLGVDDIERALTARPETIPTSRPKFGATCSARGRRAFTAMCSRPPS